MIHPFALKTRVLFLSLAMALVLVTPSFAQTDEETVVELCARLERVAGEAKTNRLIPGWCIVGAGAAHGIYLVVGLIIGEPYVIVPLESFCLSALIASPGLLFLLIPTESENFLGEFAALPGNSDEEISAKIERGEAMLETLALHGLQGRRAGAFAWFVIAALDLFGFVAESGEAQVGAYISSNVDPLFKGILIGTGLAAVTAGVLNLVLKSRAELEWEAYQTWRANPEGAVSARLESPTLRFTPTPLGFSLVVEF